MPHTQALDVRSWSATATGRIGLFLAGLVFAVGGGWGAGRLLSQPVDSYGTPTVVLHESTHR